MFQLKFQLLKQELLIKNTLQSLEDDTTPFNSFVTDSQYLGMQLDASHGVEDGDVTGSVQQISSLIQGGYTATEAFQVYDAIRDLIYEELLDLNLKNWECKYNTRTRNSIKKKNLRICYSKYSN